MTKDKKHTPQSSFTLQHHMKRIMERAAEEKAHRERMKEYDPNKVSLKNPVSDRLSESERLYWEMHHLKMQELTRQPFGLKVTVDLTEEQKEQVKQDMKDNPPKLMVLPEGVGDEGIQFERIEWGNSITEQRADYIPPPRNLFHPLQGTRPADGRGGLFYDYEIGTFRPVDPGGWYFPVTWDPDYYDVTTFDPKAGILELKSKRKEGEE